MMRIGHSWLVTVIEPVVQSEIEAAALLSKWIRGTPVIVPYRWLDLDSPSRRPTEFGSFDYWEHKNSRIHTYLIVKPYILNICERFVILALLIIAVYEQY